MPGRALANDTAAAPAGARRAPIEPHCSRAARRRRKGFTLLEAALATIIIGTGFCGLMLLVTNGTYASRTATQETTAINLANNIHEASLRLPFDQVFTLNQTFTTPVDGRLAPLANMSGWSQAVTVCYVDPNQITLPVTPASPTVRVSVSVRHHGAEAHRASWLISSPPAP